MKTIKDIVQSFVDAFEEKQRDSGEKFWVLKDGSPEWMTDAIRAAHSDMLPDDTRYKMIAESAENLLNYEPEQWRDVVSEIADSSVDIYNTDLSRWLTSHLSRAFYCDEAQSEGLVKEDAGIYDRLRIGQFMEYQEILNSLLDSFEERANEENEDEE